MTLDSASLLSAGLLWFLPPQHGADLPITGCTLQYNGLDTGTYTFHVQ
jgi:hypothetical protein